MTAPVPAPGGWCPVVVRHLDSVELAMGVPATVVTEFVTAVEVLDGAGSYSCDPSAWLRGPGRPLASEPVLQRSANVLSTSGDTHARLRRAITDSLARVELLRLQSAVESVATALVEVWGPKGRAELVGDFAIPLVLAMVEGVLGLSGPSADAAFEVTKGLRAVAEPVMSDRGHGQLTAIMADVVAAKHEAPGEDVASWLLAHPAGLSDGEAAHQLALLHRMATEPTWNLITHTLLRMSTDPDFGNDLASGVLTPYQAIDEVMHTDPGVRRSAPRFPRQTQAVDGQEVPDHLPVVVDLTAAMQQSRADRSVLRGNAGYLGWGAGAHRCPDPAVQIAKLVAGEGLNQLLHQIPDLCLAVPADAVERLPFPAHHPLQSLPVVFTPTAPRSVE